MRDVGRSVPEVIGLRHAEQSEEPDEGTHGGMADGFEKEEVDEEATNLTGVLVKIHGGKGSGV